MLSLVRLIVMMRKTPGCKLRFDVNVEYSIYRTVPHTLSSYPEQLTVPTVLVYGTESDIVHPWDRAHMLKKHDIKSMPISGTHMFPFERPQESAKLVLNVFAKVVVCLITNAEFALSNN